MDQNLNVNIDGTNPSRMDEHGVSLGASHKKRRRWKVSKGKFRAFTSNLSQGCMVVVAVLPLAGIFLGVGAAIANHTGGAGTTIGNYMANLGSFIFANLQILFAVAIAIAFTNQAPIAAFSAVVAMLVFNGLQAALINPHHIYPVVEGHQQPTVDYCNVLFWKNVPASVFTQNAGIYSMSSSVFGGIIVATVVIFFYNRFHAIKLPDVINFFGGTRFVPIVTSFAMIPVSLLMCVIWPGIGIGLSKIGSGMGVLAANGNFNAFIFGYIERALVPFGVHHAFYTPLWYTSVGGDMTPHFNEIAYIHHGDKFLPIISGEGKPETWLEVFKSIQGKGFDGNKFAGDQTLWMTLNQIAGHKVHLEGGSSYLLTFKTFTQSTLNHPAAYIKQGESYVLAFPGVNPGQYEQGKYPFMMFGLPAAGVAMILAAPKQNRKFATSMIAVAAATSFLTGITEPIEFTFLFLSPLLFWGIHAPLCALSFWLSGLFGANVGMTFSGSVIDYFIYGVLPDTLGSKTNSWILLILGVAYAPLYFFIFYFWVTHFNLATPGRGGSTRLFTKKDYLANKDQKQNKASGGFTKFDVQAYHVLNVVGGLKNVENFNACTTKLRILTKNIDLVDKNVNTLLMDLGARGVQKQGAYIMAVFGFDADLIASSMRKISRKEINFENLKTFVESNDDQSSDSNSTPHDIQKSSCAEDKVVVYSPLAGKVVSLAETEDIAFSEKVIGDGVAIVPSTGKVSAPFDGDVKVAFPSGHAYVISHDGIDVMIHIGIDTVNINNGRKPGEKLLAFAPMVKVNDKVKTGDQLSEVDLDYLAKHNYKSATPVIAVNESIGGYELKVLVDFNTTVEIGTPIFELVKKQ